MNPAILAMVAPKKKIETAQSWTTSFRGAILFLVLSMHPIGRVFLGQLGFVLPDQAAEKKNDERMQKLEVEVADVKKEVASVKSEVQGLARSFTGFQIDFEKYQRSPK